MGNISGELYTILNRYLAGFEQDILKQAQKCAKKCADNLNDASKQFPYRGRTNVPYAGSWVAKKDDSGGYVVYSKVPGLPHLLENGHSLIVHGEYHGRVPGIKHIGPVAKQSVDEYIEQIEKVVSG